MTVKLWSVTDQEGYSAVTRVLDGRQLELLNGALNYHSLVNPGQELLYRVYLSKDEEYPRLTDTSTLTGEWAADAIPLGEFRVKSEVKGVPRSPDAWDELHERYVKASDERYLRISPTVSNDAKAREAEDLRPQQKLYNYLETENAALLDLIRETRIRVDEVFLRHRIRRSKGEYFFGTPRKRAKFTYGLVKVEAPADDAPPAILFGLHWLQAGGAERWAIETIQAAKDQGFVPIIITDRLSHHYWATRPEVEGAVFIPLTPPLQRWHGDEPLLRALAETYRIEAVVLHHCAWLYQRLPWLKLHMPEVPIVDCLHIIEYKKGGYPGIGVRFDDYVDLHHVISPQLVDWMVETQGVDPQKIVLAPLAGLTTDGEAQFKKRDPNSPFTIVFLGRLARQKRPDVFLRAMKVLLEDHPDIRVIMQGGGELEPVVDKYLDDWGLADKIERRGENVPVSETLAESDLMVLTSINEGLALTVFEAIAAGIPAISTDVGSQDTLVPQDALMSRASVSLLRQIVPMIVRLKDSESAREDLWNREREAVEELGRIPNANTWVEEWMKGLKTT